MEHRRDRPRRDVGPRRRGHGNRTHQFSSGHAVRPADGRRTREQLQDSEMRRRAVFNQAREYMSILDLDGTLRDFNHSAMQLIGDCWPEDLIGKLFWIVLALAEGSDSTDRKQVESELRKFQWAVEQSPVSILITDTHAHITYTNPKFTDITGYSREEAIGQPSRMLNSGHHDENFFQQLFETVKKQDYWRGEIWNRTKAGAITVVLMTVSAVRDAAGQLTTCVRNSDTVARLGGDEFTVVLQCVEDRETVARIADDVIEALAAPFVLGQASAHISASIGIAMCPTDADEPDALTHAADKAMYEAKSEGRNRYHFSA
jgi:PAS domain S-box-containing protein